MLRLHGVRVPHKKGTAAMPPVRMGAPKTAYYPMQQNIGAPAVPCVKAGDKVYVGTLIAKEGGFVSSPIYSGVSGTVKKITDLVQASGAYVPAIVIESDGEQAPDPSLERPCVDSYESFLAAVRESGVVGLGGAGFPTAVKLSVKDPSGVEHIIINGAECEPYITSDTRTMIDRLDDLGFGIELLKRFFPSARIIFGIEKNKPECIKNMKEIVSGVEDATVMALPSVYPQGGEKVLVYHTTGKVIKEGGLPIDEGVIVLNCTTLAVIASYIQTGMPLVEKCVTVDGSAVENPCNVIVPIGTPMEDVFNFAGGFACEAGKVLYGGPMMGISVTDLSIPVLKQTNAILAFSKRDSRPRPISNCIRCGRCTNICPFGLAPVAIVTAHKNDDMAALRDLHANLCMECGCCSYVCPANRPLVQQNKLAKAELNAWLKAQKEEKK